MMGSPLRLLDFRLGRFVLVGIANTCLGLALIYFCMGLLGLGDLASNFIGYAVALLVGFWLNRRWTFGHEGDAGAALGRYLLVLAAAYLANLSFTLYALDVLHLNSYWAQAAGVVPYAAVGYVGGRLFAFN